MFCIFIVETNIRGDNCNMFCIFIVETNIRGDNCNMFCIFTVTRIKLCPLSALLLDEGLNVFNGKIRQLLSGSEDQSNVRY
jgi:hypothetical protein